MPVLVFRRFCIRVRQKFNEWALKLIPTWFSGMPFLENTENYFLRGTFDIIDLVAVALGTVIAYCVLLATHKV